MEVHLLEHCFYFNVERKKPHEESFFGGPIVAAGLQYFDLDKKSVPPAAPTA